MNPTIDLSISSKHMNCNEIMKLMKSSCKISPNITKICKNKHCWLETGCDITITEEVDIPNVWNTLKTHSNIQCGYLNIHGKYKGCILNYLRESNCPKY